MRAARYGTEKLAAAYNRKAKALGQLDTRRPPTAADLRHIQDRGACAYCGISLMPARVTIEHSVPFERGGLHTLSNLTSACRRCNSSKRQRTVEEWLATDSGISALASNGHAFARWMFDQVVVNL